MVVMTLECRMIHLSHLGMVSQEIHHLQSILYMALYAQTQCLNTLQQDKGIEWRQCGTGIAQQHGTDTGDVGSSTNSIGKHDTVIRRIGLGQCGELIGIGLPVELTAIHNHTTQ